VKNRRVGRKKNPKNFRLFCDFRPKIRVYTLVLKKKPLNQTNFLKPGSGFGSRSGSHEFKESSGAGTLQFHG
jgi:hypothetical protein